MRKIIPLIPLVFSSHGLFCQNISNDSTTKNTNASWHLTASQYYYFIPGSNTFMLTGCADHKSLHLEARYNYEDQNTLSTFAGWSFEGGKKIQFNIKPMMGILAGNTNGFAPAMEIQIAYKIFDFYAESEYVINMNGKNEKENDNNYFYAWRELAITPIKCLRTGITGQRMHLLNRKTSVQRGVFAEFSFWKLTTALYYFRDASKQNLFITSLSVHFN